MINEKLLNVLALIAGGTIKAQRDIVEQTDYSLGTVNKIISMLQSGEYVSSGDKGLKITAAGKAYLQKFKVKNAIVLAAGFGSRLLPVTLSTPKPLVSVNGRVLIESVLDGLVASGIENIYIVVGYRKEQFQYLQQKYSNIHFVTNKEYIYKNNISSINSVVDVFEQGNCCVCEADLLVNDPSIFHEHIYSSFYLSKYVEGKTGEWSFKMKNAFISSIGIGGSNVNTLMGVSYWTPDVAKIIAGKVRELSAEPSSNNLFWDEVVNICLKDVKIKIETVTDEQIIEIDTIMELIALDSSYEKYLIVE